MKPIIFLVAIVTPALYLFIGIHYATVFLAGVLIASLFFLERGIDELKRRKEIIDARLRQQESKSEKSTITQLQEAIRNEIDQRK